MKFNYPELSTVQVNGLRLYETPDGNFYPSITTVLGKTIPEEKANSLKRWQDSIGAINADKKVKDAAAHGTAVHLLAERYLLKQQLILPNDNFSPANISSFNALKLKLNNIQEVWCLEAGLYSNELTLAGRTDCIGIYNNKESIIDFKTSSKLKSSKDIEDYRLQLCAYAIMHNELFNTNIQHGVILMTSSLGFPQEFFVNLLDYNDILKERINKFYSNLQL